MHDSTQLVKQLRRTIGTPVEHNGVRCTVVELLEEPLCLVIQVQGTGTAIQDNQFGSPQRRVTQVFTIPCLSEGNAGELHQELLSLGLGIK
jgi:hypothetical protein